MELMVNSGQRAVIIGAGLAGAKTAFALRAYGYEGQIVLVGDETDPPYERPPLSKGFLSGHKSLTDILVASPEDYQDNQIDLLLDSRVTSISPSRKTVTINEQEHLDYTVLVIATGARARTPSYLRGALPGHHTLRDHGDAIRLAEQAAKGARCSIVGAGLIGSELAATFSSLGLHVTLIDPLPGPMYRILGDRVSARIAQLHRTNGVELIMNQTVTDIVGTSKVQGVRTNNGDTIEAQIIVSALGAVPNKQLAEAARIRCDYGIVTDENGRTSAQGVYAVGDVAQPYISRLKSTQIQSHWQSAIKHAERAARDITGCRTTGETIEWFWSDLYGKQIQVSGNPRDDDEILVRGDLEALDFLAFHLRDGVVSAATTIGRSRDLRRVTKLIGAATSPSRDDLLNEAIDARTLTQQG